MSDTTKKESCGCFVARHPEVAAIDAALRAGDDPRDVAQRFGIGKSRVYEHRKHLGVGPVAAPAVAPDASVEAAAPVATPAPPEPAKAAPEPPVEVVAVPEPVESVPRPMESVPRSDGAFHGTGRDPAPNPGQSSTRALPQVVETQRGTAAPVVHGTDYMQAVALCTEAITRGAMRPAVLQGIGQKLGLSSARMRHAYHEAARHLRLDMGGMLERQEASIAWTLRQREDARTKGDAREKTAEEWRRKEREAHEAASRIVDDEARVRALGDAARMGLVASKYGLEAEKWHAQALAHQRHLDGIQCLLGPKELHLTQNNFGDSGDALAKFGAELARRCEGRPDVLAVINAAVEAIEQGGGEVIEATGEAA